MDQIVVLVSGAGGDVCHGICKSLLSVRDINYRLVVCGTDDENIYRFDSRVIFELAPPALETNSYIKFLTSICRKYSVDIFFPAIDRELVFVAENKKHFLQAGVNFVCCGSLLSQEICNDKYLTWMHCLEKELPFAETWLHDDWIKIKDLGLDEKFIVKPRIGNGSKGLKVYTTSHLRDVSLESDVVIQKYIKGEEFTAGLLSDKNSSDILSIILRRKLKGGRTVFAERVINETISNQLIELARSLDIPHLNVQFFIDRNNKIVPFELNGRFSGTSGTYHSIINFAHLYIMNRIYGHASSRIKNDKIFKMIRYTEDIII